MVKPEENGKRTYGNPADVMALLAKEAEDVVVLAGKSARQEAEEETEKMLQQYEQRAKQIIVKIREEARARAEEMSMRFRDALMLRVEEASTAAMDETINSVGIKTGEIVKHLQEVVRKETRQALAEGLIAGDDKSRAARVTRVEDKRVEEKRVEERQVEEKPAAKAEQLAAEDITIINEDFGKWLMQ